MDMIIVLGLHKLVLQATLDHYGPSMYFGHIVATKYCNNSEIIEFEMIYIKSSSTVYEEMNVDYVMVFGLGGWGCNYSHDPSTSSPSH